MNGRISGFVCRYLFSHTIDICCILRKKFCQIPLLQNGHLFHVALKSRSFLKHSYHLKRERILLKFEERSDYFFKNTKAVEQIWCSTVKSSDLQIGELDHRSNRNLLSKHYILRSVQPVLDSEWWSSQSPKKTYRSKLYHTVARLATLWRLLQKRNNLSSFNRDKVFVELS